MKRILTSLLLFVAMTAGAQTYDETELIGTWKVNSVTGTLPLGIKSFSGMTLGDILLRYEHEDESYYCAGVIRDLEESLQRDDDGAAYDEYLLDFFISNGNKLHIIVDDQYSMRFTIENLTSTSMRVRSFGGSNCVIEFSKDATASVRPITRTAGKQNETYSLGGRRVKHVRRGELYIENGVKRIAD